MPTPADWLALLMTSESNEPHEWPLIGWTVRYRMTSGKYPRSVVGVVLDPEQFSYFNEWTKDLDLSDADAVQAVYEKGMAGYAGDRAVAGRHAEAVACAEHVLGAHLWEAPFGNDVLHYYSPVSMKPKGSAPKHFKAAAFTFTPAGVDPQRFVFGAGIP